MANSQIVEKMAIELFCSFQNKIISQARWVYRFENEY